MRKIVLYSSLLLLLAFSCKKEEIVNPYDKVPPNQDTVATPFANPSPVSIEGLHANFLKPTCANSGCHDGTFEPDFRTIQSSYNTLVRQKPIKNDPGNLYEARVKPFDIGESVILARLDGSIVPQMPFDLEPNSDWPVKKGEYISNLKQWIQDGAKDIFGNSPGVANGKPYMTGVAGKISGWLTRKDAGIGAIEVSKDADKLDLYFAIGDDQTPPKQLTGNEIRFSQNPDDFSQSQAYSLEVLSAPLIYGGFEQGAVNYYHHIQIDPKLFAGQVGQTVFFRIYVQDDANPLTEIPTGSSIYYIKNYFSFTLIE